MYALRTHTPVRCRRRRRRRLVRCSRVSVARRPAVRLVCLLYALCALSGRRRGRFSYRYPRRGEQVPPNTDRYNYYTHKVNDNFFFFLSTRVSQFSPIRLNFENYFFFSPFKAGRLVFHTMRFERERARTKPTKERTLAIRSHPPRLTRTPLRVISNCFF